jgi:hypothetical protein
LIEGNDTMTIRAPIGADRTAAHADRHRRQRQGQILVIVAGGLIGLLAIAALALEGGTLILNRRDGQNAADLSALAGTRVVALRYTDTANTYTQADVFDAIDESLDANNCSSSGGTPCVWEADFVGGNFAPIGPVTNSGSALPGGAVGVNVGVTRSPDAIMGHVLGFNSWEVSTEATAATGESPQMPGGILLPIALCGFGPDTAECEQANGSNAKPFASMESIALTDGKVGPGNFGWLSWDGSDSAPTLRDSLCTPDNPPFSLDSLLDDPGDWKHKDATGTNPADGETWFPGGNGKMNSSGVRACLNHWITTGATVLIPIYDVTSDKVGGNNNGANNLAYHIVGIAAMVLTAIDQPAVDRISAKFIDYYPLTEIPAGGSISPPNPNSVTTFIGLVK